MDMEKKPISELDAAAEEPEPSSKEIIASLARQFYGMGWFPGKVMGVKSFNYLLLPIHSKYRIKLIILQNYNHLLALQLRQNKAKG